MIALAAPYLLLRRVGDDRISHAERPRQTLASFSAQAVEPNRRGGLLRQDAVRLIAARQFQLALQPVVRLRDLRPIGQEALLRLRQVPGAPPQSTRGFTDAAQSWGLGAALDEAVVDVALATRTDDSPRPVSVNIASRSLRDPVFFTRLLDRVSGQGAWIAVEITGVAGFEDLPSSIAAVMALRDAGVRVGLDEFLPTEAMLACLQAAQFDEVKLAGAIVGNALASSRGQKLIAALLKLAEATGARVVAKQVETEQQAALLRTLGLGYGQGWLFGAPVVPTVERMRESTAASASSPGPRLLRLPRHHRLAGQDR